MWKKSHTSEEGGAHLKIYFWHLLINLKSKYLFEKMLKLANKKENNFNIYNPAFKTKDKKPGDIIILHLRNKNLRIWC